MYGSGSWEAEGFKIFKINDNTFRIFVGYKLGTYKYSGIFYFDVAAQN